MNYICKHCGTQDLQILKEGMESLPQKRMCPKCKGSLIKDEESAERISFFCITLEESIDDEATREAKTIPVEFCHSDGLASPEWERRLSRGTKIRLAGYLFPKKENENDAEETFWFKALGVDVLNDEYEEVKVTPEAIEELHLVKELQKNNSLVEYFRENLFTTIAGEDNIKESLIVQLISAPRFKKAGHIQRGDIHVLMCGEPGTAKSTFLKMVQNYAAKSRYITGGGTSGVGVTASVIKDEVLGAWVAEAGAFPLANRGVLLLDEADKMQEEDINKLHEGMEQQTISINKSNIHVTIPAQTKLLAAANPKYGNFDRKSNIYKQLDFSPTFINRFDVVWVLLDDADEEKDARIAKSILKQENNDKEEPVALFKQYQVHAQTLKATMPPEIQHEICAWYVQLRKTMTVDSISVRFNARTLIDLQRLTLAHARAELREEADMSDFTWAKKIYLESLKTVAIDQLTGTLDVQIVQFGMARSESNLLRAITNALEKAQNNELWFHELAKMFNNITPTDLEEHMVKLKQKGIVFEPRNGFYKLQRASSED